MKIEDVVQNNYDNLSLDEKKELHELYLNAEREGIELGELYTKLHSIVYRMTPPTPEEYLDPKNKWITKPFYDSLYDHVKEDFCEILNKDKNYLQAVEYGGTRLGKSYLARMLIHYTFIYVHCLRHPQLYYKLGPTTKLTIYIMSFVSEKVNQLLLDPIYKLFEMSPRFKKIHLQDKVKDEQKKIGLETIIWSKAGTGSKITVESGLTLGVGTDFMSFIGSDMLQLYVSELNFFREKAGTTDEEIYQLYSDGLERIKATVGNQHLSMVYLDSSANDRENKIEKYIIDYLPKQKNVFFRNRSRWQARPYLFPIWQKTGETFTICIGDGTIQAKIINVESELKDIPKHLLVEVPIDAKEDFERNLLKSIKDIAGIPTIRENKFISNYQVVDNMFRYNELDNIEGLVIADSADKPEGLLYSIVRDRFFEKHNLDTYHIKRAVSEKRFIGLDLAHAIKGDIMGFCMLHKEWSSELEQIMYVIDFAFGIGPGSEGINLSAIKHFILDLVIKGQVYIANVSSDSFQNVTIAQDLKRDKIDTVTMSIEKSLEPYMNFLNKLMSQSIVSGKNIFLKNNLKSLQIVRSDKGKEKVDHTYGSTENVYHGDWEYSVCGVNANDVADAVCHALFHATEDLERPLTIFEQENKKVNIAVDSQDMNDFIKSAYSSLHRFY